MDKKCSKCKEWKDISCFPKHCHCPDGLSYYCKSCKIIASKESRIRHREENREHNNIRHREYYANNRSKISERRKEIRKANPNGSRENTIKTSYGISLQEWQKILDKQNGKCAICEIDLPQNGLKTHTDHDHKNGKIRGILCQSCNLGLGFFKDNKELLFSTITYLENAER